MRNNTSMDTQRHRHTAALQSRRRRIAMAMGMVEVVLVGTATATATPSPMVFGMNLLGHTAPADTTHHSRRIIMAAVVVGWVPFSSVWSGSWCWWLWLLRRWRLSSQFISECRRRRRRPSWGQQRLRRAAAAEAAHERGVGSHRSCYRRWRVPAPHGQTPWRRRTWVQAWARRIRPRLYSWRRRLRLWLPWLCPPYAYARRVRAPRAHQYQVLCS